MRNVKSDCENMFDFCVILVSLDRHVATFKLFYFQKVNGAVRKQAIVNF